MEVESNTLDEAKSSELEKVEEVEEKTPKIEFERLTPNDNTDLNAYKEALDYGIKNKMTNIALSGPYGSGKSSVIEAYKKKNNKKTFMHISLSHFEGSNEVDTQILEGKIINQLLHQIEFKKIPRTIFKAKENQSKLKMFGAAIVVFLFISSVVITFRFSNWKNFYINFFSSEKFPDWLISNTFHLLVFLFFVFLLIYLIYKFINLQLNQQILKKVIFKGNEFEIFKDSNESYFDKFMNDVIYLFINSGKDIIVFEDLDRFDNTTIYEKLHEINTLVNRRLSLKGMKKLTFIYLIKDDTFKSKDRTKFFDLLIPVVPVVDSSNSFDQFLSIFEKNKIRKDFDLNIIRKISFYIDDMRLLKNINNEYIIYKSRLKKITLDYNKLISIIIYKNLFPEDFSLFQSGVGYINSVIKSKEVLLSRQIQDLSEEIESLKSSVIIAKEEHLNNIDELDAVYLRLVTNGYFSVNGRKEVEFPTSKDFIRAIKDNNYIINKHTPRGSYHSVVWDSSELNVRTNFNELKNNQDYKSRLASIDIQKKIEIYHNKILNLENEKKEKLNSTLSKILENTNNDFFIDTQYFNKNFYYLFESQYFPIIIFLLREGLIDENYGDYVTYFYENSLKKNDKEFLRGVYDRKPKNSDYKLEDLKQIISSLTSNDIDIYSIKNIYLADYLISIYPENNGFLESVINVMKGCKDNSYILDLYELSKENNHIQKFTKVLDIFWPQVFIDIISKSTLEERNLEFFYVISSFAQIKFLQRNNKDNLLTKYISEEKLIYPSVLTKEQQNNLLENFNTIGIKFRELGESGADINYLKEVISSRMFCISESNLEQILQIHDIEYSKNEFKSSNLTLFSKENPDNIYDYLTNENINEYIQIYLKFGTDTLKENSDVFVDILNLENLNKELAFELIKKTKLANPIEDVEYINNTDYWDRLLIADHIKIDEFNIVSYYSEADNKFSEHLVKAINQTSKKITFSKVNMSDKTRENMAISIINNNQFEDMQYISMLNSLDFYWARGFKIDVSSVKVKKLIYAKIIRSTKDNLSEILNNHMVNLIDFVQVDIDNFCNLFREEDLYQFDVLLSLLNATELTDSQKKKIVDLSEQGISIRNLKVSSRVQQYILENKFSENDFVYILENYSTFSKIVQTIIYEKSISNIEKVIQEEIKMNIELLRDILAKEDLDDREIIFSHYIQLFNDDETIYYIRNLNYSEEFISLLKRGRPKFNKSSINRRILKDFKRRNWVTKIEEEDNYFRVQGRLILK